MLGKYEKDQRHIVNVLPKLEYKRECNNSQGKMVKRTEKQIRKKFLGNHSE